MWPDHFDIDVSRESIEKLEVYHALLLKWQRAINLVSPKTINDAWVRHFADSAQIVKHLPAVLSNVSRESSDNEIVLADLGCGAGFPGLVIAILRPDIKVHLVESDQRKCQFLKTVSRETGVDVTVHNQRIESCTDIFLPDIVTARALADLPALLGYISPWVDRNPALECIFLKGARAQKEVEAAEQKYMFDASVQPSVSDKDASVVFLRNIAAKS